MIVSTTIQKSISTILQIASNYLNSVMESVSESTIFSKENDDGKEPVDKKTKTQLSEINKNEMDNIDELRSHIHIIFELFNITEIGGKDDALTMIELIKMVQLAAKYFFLCMIEKGKYLVVKDYTNDVCSNYSSLTVQ